MLNYLIIGVVLLFLVGIFSRFYPTATHKITENLYVVRCIYVNFYVFKSENNFILFDTGMSPLIAKRGLKKLGIETDMVTHIFLTHTDLDHAGGLLTFPQAKVYLSTAEEQMINGNTARRGFMHNKRIRNYNLMEDGDTVLVGDTSVKIYFAPGHTPGSAAFLIDNDYLASGDLLRISRKGTILPFLWLMNMKHSQNIESVKAMQPVISNVEYILSAHTGIYKFVR